MPVVQISRIQHRRGLSIDLPNPSLAEGEIGMTIDTGEMFIGAPNFPPIVNRTTYPYQNLRILTEFSVRDVLTNLQYVYRDQQRYKFADADQLNPDFPGLKSYGANPGWTVERLLQERLDEVVSVKSYGARGNAYENDYLAIERACLDLYTD
ncbi:MAG: hypothetical protein HC836_31905, partial [Richelia sp. RM2_1_2]|nr:hypothetical protein [Richelia sp. RM2_1_2]